MNWELFCFFFKIITWQCIAVWYINLFSNFLFSIGFSLYTKIVCILRGNLLFWLIINIVYFSHLWYDINKLSNQYWLLNISFYLYLFIFSWLLGLLEVFILTSVLCKILLHWNNIQLLDVSFSFFIYFSFAVILSNSALRLLAWSGLIPFYVYMFVIENAVYCKNVPFCLINMSRWSSSRHKYLLFIPQTFKENVRLCDVQNTETLKIC